MVLTLAASQRSMQTYTHSGSKVTVPLLQSEEDGVPGLGGHEFEACLKREADFPDFHHTLNII